MTSRSTGRSDKLCLLTCRSRSLFIFCKSVNLYMALMTWFEVCKLICGFMTCLQQKEKEIWLRADFIMDAIASGYWKLMYVGAAESMGRNQLIIWLAEHMIRQDPYSVYSSPMQSKLNHSGRTAKSFLSVTLLVSVSNSIGV